MKLLSLVPILLFLTFYQVNALTCYLCNSLAGGSCDAPNQETNTVKCNGYCIYYKFDNNKANNFSRICSHEYVPRYVPQEFPGHKCDRNVQFHLSGIACYCNTDRCVAEHPFLPTPSTTTTTKKGTTITEETKSGEKTPDETKSKETKSGERADKTNTEGKTASEKVTEEQISSTTGALAKENTMATEQIASTQSTNGSQELICSSFILFIGLIASYFVGF